MTHDSNNSEQSLEGRLEHGMARKVVVHPLPRPFLPLGK